MWRAALFNGEACVKFVNIGKWGWSMKLRHSLLITTAVSGVLGVSSVGVASADDYNWSGFYAGFGVSAGRANDGGTLSWSDPDSDIEDILTSFPIVSHEPQPIFDDGALGDFPGALEGFGIDLNAGYNLEVDNFLLGVEVDILTGPIKSEATYNESGTLSYSTSSGYAVSTTFGTSTTSVTTTSSDALTSTSVSTSTYTYVTSSSVNPTSTLVYTTSNTITTITSTIVGTTSTITTYASSGSTTLTSTTGTTYYSSTVTDSFNTSSFLTSSTSTYIAQGSWASTITGRAQIDWLSTIKGRVGFTADRTLFFATGGLAIGGVTQETSGTLSVNDASSEDYTWHGSKSETRTGFVVGGGVEQALDDHWIVSGSAEYFSLGDVEYDVVSDDGLNTIGKATQALDGYNVNVGIKYKF